MKNEPILEVKHITKKFRINKKTTTKAVSNISFKVYPGETVGIVGESGCGKTTTGMMCLGLINPTAGKILYNGEDISCLTRKDKKVFTSKAQIIFQNPYSSLDPKMKIIDIVAEGLEAHNLIKNKTEKKERVSQLLTEVGLNPNYCDRYIHEFSGGQRQRIGIARALAVEPEFIVCDEPLSALDVSIQAQIVNLLIDLQKKRNITYLFIAHDLSMVKYISDRVIVMYLGEIVEINEAQGLYDNPLHPYTQALLSAIPIINPQKSRKRIKLTETNVKESVTEGCCFYTHCRFSQRKCAISKPNLKNIKGKQLVACHFIQG